MAETLTSSSTADDRVIVRHPLLVVCVPVHNEETHLEETLRSLRDQSFEDFAVLISDNCSSDSSVVIARRMCDEDHRFTLYVQPANIGAAENFNFLCDATESKYLVWLGAHDLLHPTFLETHIGALERDPDAVLSFSAFSWINEKSEELQVTNDGSAHRLPRWPILSFILSVRAIRYCIEINHPIRRSQLRERFRRIKGTDHLILSALAGEGRFLHQARALYSFRCFDCRSTDQTERLLGERVAQQSYRPLILAYKDYYWKTFPGIASYLVYPLLFVFLEETFSGKSRFWWTLPLAPLRGAKHVLKGRLA